MSTSSGTTNPVKINAITLFCAGFTKTQIKNAENLENGLYFYHKDILDIDQSAWRRYTSTYSEDFAEAKENAENLGVLFVDGTNKDPWGAEKISNEPRFHLRDFVIVPTYLKFVEDEAQQALATPNPQAGGKSHKKRRKSRKKRRKSRKKRRKSRKKRRKSRSKKRRTKGRKKRKRKK